MTDDPITLASMAAYLSYVKNVEDCGGRYFKEITTDQSHWLNVARLAFKHRIDPGRFVTAQFLSLAPARRMTLTPRMLHTPKKVVVARAVEHSPSPCNYEQLAMSLLNKAKTLAARRKCGLDEVLQDPEQMFPPWFRLAYVEKPNAELVDMYMEASCGELEALENYDLKKFLIKEGSYGRFTNTDNKRKHL
jgi:hypothetical protein